VSHLFPRCFGGIHEVLWRKWLVMDVNLETRCELLTNSSV
jgi:hypothetical protein